MENVSSLDGSKTILLAKLIVNAATALVEVYGADRKGSKHLLNESVSSM